MLHFTSDQFIEWLGLYFWPLLRVMALIMTAPILSEKSIPKRVKIGLGMLITFVIAPTLPPVNVPIFSPQAIWLALQQVLIGVAIGFTMQLAFAAIRTAGELIGLAMLLFLTFNGHLWLISMLVDTFHTLPIGGNPVNSNAFLALTRAAGLIFINGLMLALPVITLLLTVNLSLGLLNRMAPQLSVFVIGFPITLTVGLILMGLLMPLIAPFCEHLFSEIFNLLSDIVRELPRNTNP